MKLGREFVDKIGGGLNEADLYLQGAGKLELAEHRSRTEIPDGEPLLMHGVAGKDHVNLKQDIYAIKQNHRLMISLGDFCSAADFAITVNPSKGTADGWFIRETQQLHLDARARQVTIMGKTSTIAPEDIVSDGKDVLVAAELLEKWFNISFDYDFANLALIITTYQPFPAEDAYRRSRLSSGGGRGESTVKLPRVPTQYGAASLPYIDTTLSSTIIRPAGGKVTNSETLSTITSGDVAGFNMQTFTSAHAERPYLDTFRMTLGKEDIDGNLLGPLHATAYKFGDVDTVPLPLISTGRQEQGVSVTNLPPNEITTQTSAPIRGDAQPGWDVELYRNDVFIDIRHVDMSGRYDFGNVDLIVGDNDFKLLFYGLQGETREEHRHIGVNPIPLAAGASYYNASITREDVTTYEAQRPTDPGVGDPRMVANYQYGLGRIGALNLGVRNSNDAGVDRTFTQAGLSSFVAGTFLNADVGYDVNNSAYSTIMTARHNFGRQSALLQYTTNSPDYNIVSATPAVIKDTLRSTLSGPLPGKLGFLDHLNYSVGATNTNNYDGSSELNLNSSLTSRYKTMLFTAAMDYARTTDASGAYGDSATADFTSRGFAYGGNWRVEAQYQVKPVAQMTQDLVEYDHPIGKNVDTLTQIKYIPNPRLADATFSVNWRTPKATISPLIEADTARNMTLGLNVHFSAGANPYTNKYGLYNAYMAETGGVAARIFFDKNGDGVYNAGDELLPDVELKALQQHKTATSNEQGIAFIPDIEKNILTDITVDQTSLKDSFDMAMFDGVSISPHPGGVTQLEFPVVAGGEMDGQADYVDSEGKHTPGRNLHVALVAPDGKVEKDADAAYDGYWSISSIKPGVYYLVATPPEGSSAGYTPPRRLEFGPEGTTLYGQPLVLKEGHNIPFRFRSVNAVPSGPRGTRVIRPSDIVAQEVLIDLGHFHSRLALTFAWYEFRLKSGWSGLFDPVTPIAQIAPDAKTAEMALMLRPKQAFSLEQAGFACNRLDDLGFNCSVETVTRYRDGIPAPADTRRVSATY